MRHDTEARHYGDQQRRNPLGFFVIALSVTEAVMGAVVATARMSPVLTFAALCVTATLFLAVVGAVTYITVRWPHHLYEQVGRDLRLAKQMAEYTRSQVFRDAIGDIIA